MENMPLFIATIFAGLLAESRVGTDRVGLNSFVYGWMAVRVLYTANYITTETRAWSYLRSLLVSLLDLDSRTRLTLSSVFRGNWLGFCRPGKICSRSGQLRPAGAAKM